MSPDIGRSALSGVDPANIPPALMRGKIGRDAELVLPFLRPLTLDATAQQNALPRTPRPTDLSP